MVRSRAIGSLRSLLPRGTASSVCSFGFALHLAVRARVGLVGSTEFAVGVVDAVYYSGAGRGGVGLGGAAVHCWTKSFVAGRRRDGVLSVDVNEDAPLRMLTCR